MTRPHASLPSRTIYATGAGTFDHPPANGALSPASPLAMSALTPTITVGNAPASVLFAGLAPNVVGLVQINIQLPGPLPSGSSLPLIVSFGANAAPPVNLAVH